jgi:hypothetical protein
MNNRCIVNLATTRYSPSDVDRTYTRAQQRLLSTATEHGIPVVYWTDSYPPNSPTHAESPYEFKAHAFLHAMEQGFSTVLWCDANVWVRKDPTPIFEQIERDGHVLFRNGWNCGQWCTDSALATLGLSRDDAMHIPDFTGCCMGLDLTNETARRFLREWKAAAEAGTFRGPWKNENGSCSTDPRCMGHRHDQVVGSIIAHRLEMKLTDPLPQFSYWQGGNIPDSVIMVNGR